MAPFLTHTPPVAAIVTYLFTQRETILNTWRTVCEKDPALNKVLALSREEFNNLLPVILDVQYSGPGLPSGLAGVFGEQLRPTVEATSVLSPSESEPVAVLPVDVPKIPTGAALDQQTNRSRKEKALDYKL